MVCLDWRLFGTEEVARLLDAEKHAWTRDLDWDLGRAWASVEPARQVGHLPGFIAVDDAHHPVGWTAFLVHRAALQVYAFVASNRDVAHQLIDAILEAPEAETAQSVVFCVRASSSGLAEMLADRGFLVEPYRYLSSPVADDEPGDRFAPWSGHTQSMARLCARAYADADGIRAFAPDGTIDAWQEYIASLVAGPGCGEFAPDLSHVVPAAAGEIDAAILVTTLGPGTAHVAQLAVDPTARGRHLGRDLVRRARSAAARRGDRQMTLLVAASNRPAARVYEQLGFRDRAGFVVAVRDQPTSSTSLALATGGDSTRL